LAARYCNRFLFIKDGKVYLSGGQEVLTPENIYEVYGMDVDILEHKGNKVIVAV
jgi:iron complex transport system ATP-binding protein